MPYIPKESRKLYDEDIDSIVKNLDANTEGEPHTPWNNGYVKGDLNYIFMRIIRQYERLLESKNYSCGYQNKSDFVAALRDCADEYVRRFLAPYEDEKIDQNGDIW